MEKNKKLNLQDIVDIVASKQNVAKEEADVFVKTLFSIIQESLSEDNPVKIKDFGTFKLTLIQARESVDVNTGEKIEIPAHYRFSFLPATILKELVNKPFANFETTLLNDGFHSDDIPVENEDENEHHDIIFVVEKKLPEENVQYEVEHKMAIFEEKTSIIEQNPKKQPFISILGVVAASAAIIAVGLLFRKR
ncbi:MAG: HU family DNA-binding protein [Dysgonamonadaceae bacterium]|jgi:nucleoid DNA-binding protein|nr:HU family DNA-binding protein [Dysgonamonadaceae bacterium]